MPLPRINLLAVWLVLCGTCNAAVEAPIRSVVVYSHTAVIERELSVAAGSRHIEVGGLPTGFDIDSLHMESPDGVHFGQASLKDEATTTSPDPREAALNEHIQALKDQEALLDVEAKAAETTNAVIGRLTLGTSGNGGGTLAIDGRSLGGILAEVRKSSADALTTLHTVAVKKRDLDKQIAAADRDLERLQSNQQDLRTLSFDIAADQPGTIRISYPQTGAGWTPTYRALLNSATGQVTLERQARVHQSTGEDWTDVHLRLSTGRPQLNVRGPDAEPWKLALDIPRVVQLSLADKALAPTAPPRPKPVPMRARGAAFEPAVEESEATFATEFTVPLPATVPSDGSEATLTLGDKQLDATVRIRTVPRLQAVAYVEAEAARPDGVWLPGSIQLLRDGDYVGQTQWQPDAAEKFILPFGRDDLIHVRYERKDEHRGTSGLLTKRNSQAMTDVLTLTSNHHKAVPLLILESSPVAENDDIKVSSDFTPKPDVENWHEKTGVVGWKLSINPGATVTLQAHYEISWPEKKEINGLQ